MKLRSLLLSTVVLLALVGTLYWSEHRKGSADTTKVSADTPPAIVHEDEAGISRIELKKKDADPIVLTKSGSGTWQITRPKELNADQSTVNSLASSFSSLASERLVEEKASDLKQYGLDQPSEEVDVTGKNNQTQKLLLGDETPTGSAAYAKLAADPRVFTIAGYTKNNFDKSLNDLRDKRLITMAADQVSRLELAHKGQTIEFGRNKNDWQILKPKPSRADGAQVGDLVRKLTEAKMELSGPNSESKEADSGFAHGTPVATAKLTDQSGSQELQIHKQKDTYYAKSSNVEGAYKIDSSLAQALDKGVDDFRNKKIFDFGYTDPDKIEIHAGTKAYFLSKSGTDWWSNGKKMDAATVDDLVSKLRNLDAAKFVDSGFGKPEIQISVTSDGGKRVETVSLAKAGNDYLAKRDNDSTLYELQSGPVDEMQKAADGVKPAAASSK
jgi:hypothetical protein